MVTPCGLGTLDLADSLRLFPNSLRATVGLNPADIWTSTTKCKSRCTGRSRYCVFPVKCTLSLLCRCAALGPLGGVDHPPRYYTKYTCDLWTWCLSRFPACRFLRRPGVLIFMTPVQPPQQAQHSPRVACRPRECLSPQLDEKFQAPSANTATIDVHGREICHRWRAPLRPSIIQASPTTFPSSPPRRLEALL